MISPGGGWAGVDWAGPVEARESLSQRPQPPSLPGRTRVVSVVPECIVLLSCPPGARDTSRRESSASPAWETETTDLVS